MAAAVLRWPRCRATAYRFASTPARLHTAYRTTARCPAPQHILLTAFAVHVCAQQSVVSSATSCNTILPACGMVRALNPSCPKCHTNGALHPVSDRSRVKDCPKRNLCLRVFPSVSACFRVLQSLPMVKSSCSVTPSSRVRSHHRRRRTSSTASEPSAAPHRLVAYFLMLCLPFGYRP